MNRSCRSAADRALFRAARAADMRDDMTDAECAMDAILREVGGCWWRQFSIECGGAGVIVDFYQQVTPNDAVAIEVDGKVHRKQRGHDERRDRKLRRLGITTLRFTNEEVLRDPAGVRERILEAMG